MSSAASRTSSAPTKAWAWTYLRSRSSLTSLLRQTAKPLEYPAHFEVRLVSQDSTIRWNSRKVFVGHLLGRQHVGLEQVAEAVWSVYFGPIHLGWLDEADYRIMDVMERQKGDAAEL